MTKAIITNIYENEALENSGLKNSHGQSFLIEIDDQKILFDTGTKGKEEDFIYNLDKLGFKASEIDQLVLSHGHYDHTGGLPLLLDTRKQENDKTKTLTIILHPRALEEKIGKKEKKNDDGTIEVEYLNIGFAKLSPALDNYFFLFTKKPCTITEHLTNTGEIKVRNEKDGTSERLLIKEDGEYRRDMLLDDQSLILETSNGLVVICGCCHAGLLNTLKRVREIKGDKPITTIFGGTHMGDFSREEVNHVADILEKNYNTPKLYLNHCTGKETIKILKERFGENIVKPSNAGSKFEFEI